MRTTATTEPARPADLLARRGLLGALGVAGAAIPLAFAGPARAEPEAAPATTSSFDVRDFGALGDGSTDDTQAFRDTVAAVAAAGGGRMHVPAGVYMISGPVYLTSDMVLAGDGDASVIRATLTSGWTTADRQKGILNIVGAVRVQVRDLCVDQNSSQRELAHYVQYSMLLNTTEDIAITNVTFRDAGLRKEVSRPTGPILAVFANEENAPSPAGGGVGGNYRVYVGNCRFLQQGAAQVQFGIRVRSDWQADIPLEAYEHYNDDIVFENCHFDGYFLREGIEFAGRTNRFNQAIGCTFVGQYSTAIDFDKGTSYSVAAFNRIDGIRQPEENVPDPNILFFPITDHGALYTFGPYFNVGNVIAYNTITACATPGAGNDLEAAFYVAGTRDTRIIGNTVDGFHGGAVGGGLRLDVDEVRGLILRDNVFKGVNWGIRTPATERPAHFQDTLHDVVIADNTIEAAGRTIWLTTAAPGGKHFRIHGNRLATGGAATPNVETGQQVALLFTGNAVTGGDVGVLQFSPRAVLSTNVISGAATASIDVRAETTVLANVTDDAATNDLVTSDGTRLPTLVANSFAGPDAALGPAISYAEAQPSTGTWRAGDQVYRSRPSAGAPFGWVCVAAGTPGTWRAIVAAR
ncbi:glycosyl hydrolase family 28-related protein [Occultella aeris]|uniref:Pectate lyase superfamily protein n=1 Tax=Occultella aeris TaxID=2761496 RepID=A0A7M4DGK8_9MICO|nr:glycosyl hydrolase family 28-related protein [Occultella aeris]VZO36051.1 Pectate lyase superfamily protein [Occultella aeris]